jgi:hypothetical protein
MLLEKQNIDYVFNKNINNINRNGNANDRLDCLVISHKKATILDLSIINQNCYKKKAIVLNY